MKQLRHARPDYIIIGAGTAGCVLANRLSKFNVTLIEAGSDKNSKIRMPAAYSQNPKSKYIWGYQTEPQSNLNNRSISIPRGKIVGGTTSVNDMSYTRGHPLDYKEWAQIAPGWTYRDCLLYFKKAECHELGETDYRGSHGPLKLTRSKDKNQLTDAFVDAGIQRGYKYTLDVNGYQQEGVGPMDKMIYKGQRWNTASAYLQVVRHLIDLRTETQANKLIIESDKCIGVEVERKGIKEILYAEKEVILSAGVMESPHLMMLSGIGQNLEHGIKVIKELPVGQNLQDQLELHVQCSYETNLTFKQNILEPFKSIQAQLEWFLFNEGPYASNYIDFGAFIRSNSELQQPDCQIKLINGIIDSNHNFMPQQNTFQMPCKSLKPKSTGFIKLQSDNPKDPLIIQPNYLEDSNDLKQLAHHLEQTIEYLKSQCFNKLSTKFTNIDPNQNDSELHNWIRKNAISAYHPVGTCAMGQVTDESGRVKGIQNLRIVDASIIPKISSANTSASVIMMAEKISDAIKGVKMQSADIPFI